MLKVIEEFPKYVIDENGYVFNKETGYQLKRRTNTDGYYIVYLNNGKKYHYRRCGRLVGLTFLKDTYEEGLVIDHIDHDRTNDHVSNLEWVTTLENNLRSIRINPHKHTRDSDYTEDFIHEVCKLIQDGIRNVDIIKQTNISKDTLLHIRCNATWTWISKNYIMTPSRRGISEETAKWICYKIKDGLTNKEILTLSNHDKISIDIVKKIRNNKSWTKISKHIL